MPVQTGCRNSRSSRHGGHYVWNSQEGHTNPGGFAEIVSKDGSVVALIPAIGEPVAVSAQIPDLSEMITNVRIRRAP